MKLNYNRALAVIPARGGSKRIPRKNLRMLHDKPLVCHTLDAAAEAGCFDTIALSSDDDEILALADRNSAVTPLKREPEFAHDHATVFSFLQHFVTTSPYAGDFDAIALLLPTAPFRGADRIAQVAEKLDQNLDSVITVSAYDFPVQFAVEIDEKDALIKPVFEPSPLITGNTRSQNQAPVFHPNGAMFMSWWDFYADSGSFYKGRTGAVIMDPGESLDIDREEDFAYAEYLMRNNQS